MKSDEILIKTFDQVKNDNFDQVKFDQVIVCLAILYCHNNQLFFGEIVFILVLHFEHVYT